jgi:hypothetical protein
MQQWKAHGLCYLAWMCICMTEPPLLYSLGFASTLLSTQTSCAAINTVVLSGREDWKTYPFQAWITKLSMLLMSRMIRWALWMCVCASAVFFHELMSTLSRSTVCMHKCACARGAQACQAHGLTHVSCVLILHWKGWTVTLQFHVCMHAHQHLWWQWVLSWCVCMCVCWCWVDARVDVTLWIQL